MAAPAPGGIRFGNYVLLRRIARGGMAEVFLAQQRGLEGFDRRVAVKRILPHLADAPDFVKMFLAEAKLAAALSHPNIVHIYDFGKHDGDYFIAMEYVDGVHAGDLFRIAEKEKLPPALVARIGADAAVALHHAHELRGSDGKPLGLVHRDVSPANIMVSYDGVAKLCDFGIAKAAALGEQLTNPGQVKGKYAYMSPEQTTASQLDGRSDVFSLGIVLWELLAGRTIVGRTDAVESMRAIRDGKLPTIQSVVPKTPSGLAKALNWAMQTDREKRATPLQFASALEAYIKSSPDLATPLHLGMWIRARFPRALEVGSALPADVVARAAAAGLPARPSSTQIVEGTVEGTVTPMPPIDGLREPTVDLLEPPHRDSARETQDLREHLRNRARGADVGRAADPYAKTDYARRDHLARPTDSLEQRPPLELPDTPPTGRDSVGSLAHTSPRDRQSEDSFDGAATVSVPNDAPMFLRDGVAPDPFANDKETEVDEARPEVAWSGFEPEAGAHATHPQRNPPGASSARAPSPSFAAHRGAPSSSRAPSSPSSAPPNVSASKRAPSSPSSAPPNVSASKRAPSSPSSAPLNLPASDRAPSSPSSAPLNLPSSSASNRAPSSPSRAPSSPSAAPPLPGSPRPPTLPPPVRANTPASGGKQMPQRTDINPLTGISHLSPSNAAPSSAVPNAPGSITPSNLAARNATTEPYPQRANPFGFEGSSGAETVERNAASMEVIPMPTGAEAALRSLEDSRTDLGRGASPSRAPSVADGVPPASDRGADRSGGNRADKSASMRTADRGAGNRDERSAGNRGDRSAGTRVPPGTDAGSRRGPTINPLPLPLRAPDPNFDPQRPFHGDQSGELVVGPSGPMPGTSASIVASMPGPADVIAPRAPTAPRASSSREQNIQLQPSRRTVAIGAFIAIAVVAFTTALAIRSCHEHHTTNNAGSADNDSASAAGSGSADTGSATKPRPTVEPITE